MATLKCKMCGGDLQLIEDSTICECEYCGSKQTVPTVDDEKKQKLYDRANKLRFNCDFDKAAGVFENIVNEFPDDAESYWGLVLCKYGIEYVDDPASSKKVPTCHRSSFDSVMDDPDFDMVMENAESDARALYRQEAKQIEELRRSILEVSGREQPYDIFICYKETDDDGQRTIDSVIAQDVYDALTDKGYRVFFSRISLEDKLGTEYEPYIFAALNSAKLMLAFGTSYDYYNAVWVKNEWSRFLKLMASDKEKYLIPCYKDIDAYDIPKEFAKFQAQDMGKVGAMQDLMRGIDKIFGKDIFQTNSQTQEQQIAGQVMDYGMSALNAQTAALLKRGYMALEDSDFDRANDFFEQVLNNDAECGQAYWGKVFLQKKSRNEEELAKVICTLISEEQDLKKVVLPDANLVKLAREVDDTCLLKNISDDELRMLLKEYNYTIQYQSAEHVLKNIMNNLNEISLKDYVNCRDYDRALEYHDEIVAASISKVIERIKGNLIVEEEGKRNKAENQLLQRDQAIKNIIIKRLAPFITQNIVVGEKVYSNDDNKTYLIKQIAELNREKEKQKGLFADKRKKKLEDSINELQSRLSANNSFEDREGFENNHLDELIKCALSDDFKKTYNTRRLIQSINKAKIGDEVLFGQYMYEKLGEKEPLKWIVIDVKDNKRLLITKYGIDAMFFNEEQRDIAWDQCTLREWLNSYFLNTFCTEIEKNCIVGINAKQIDELEEKAKKDTVSLLSIAEVKKYFRSNSDRIVEATPYAKGKGAAFDNFGNCVWWLRMSNSGASNATDVVMENGRLNTGALVHGHKFPFCVRPTIWISVSNDMNDI